MMSDERLAEIERKNDGTKRWLAEAGQQHSGRVDAISELLAEVKRLRASVLTARPKPSLTFILPDYDADAIGFLETSAKSIRHAFANGAQVVELTVNGEVVGRVERPMAYGPG